MLKSSFFIFGFISAKPFFTGFEEEMDLFDYGTDYGSEWYDSEHSHITVVDRIQMALNLLETELIEKSSEADNTIASVLIDSNFFTNKSAVVANTPSSVGKEFPEIWNYGCWCYFNDNWGKGKGVPVNEVDNICKVLHDGYECIIHDHKVEYPNESCDPWTVDYVSAVSLGRNLRQLENYCVKYNQNACAQRTCIIESHFAQSFFKLAINKDHRFEPLYKHELGFDPEDKRNCPTIGGKKSEKSCCGIYPERYPFKTFDGQRQCCKRQTYDVNVRECCNGVVSGLGTC